MPVKERLEGTVDRKVKERGARLDITMESWYRRTAKWLNGLLDNKDRLKAQRSLKLD